MGSLPIIQRSLEHVAKLNAQLQEQGLLAVSAQSFCILPFVHLSTTTTGELRLCCRSETIGNIRTENLSDLWVSEKMQSVRDDLVKGVRRKECRACWKLEDLGMVSLRMGQNIIRTQPNQKRVAGWLQDKTIQPLQNIELKLSNLCNLKCRMCSPIASTPWIREWDKIKDLYSSDDAEAIEESYQWQKEKREPVLDFFMHNESFLRDFESIADSIEELEFAGGEPLLDPLHYEVLRRVQHRAPEITLKYSTNLMVLGTTKYKALEIWPSFKKVKLTVSVDGPARLNEYIRTGTNSAFFENHIREVKKLSNVELKASTCVSAYNALFLVDTLEYVASLGMSWYSNRVSSPKFLDARNVPQALRAREAQKLRSLGPADMERLGFSQNHGELSLRTAHDCASWLEDSKLDSRAKGEFDKFLNYVRRLDAVRKTDYSEFFQKNSEAGTLFALAPSC